MKLGGEALDKSKGVIRDKRDFDAIAFFVFRFTWSFIGAWQ